MKIATYLQVDLLMKARECYYSDIDSLVSVYGMDTLYVCTPNPRSYWGELKQGCLFRNEKIHSELPILS